MVVGPRLLLLPTRAPTKNAEIAVVVVDSMVVVVNKARRGWGQQGRDSSSPPLLVAGLALWPWSASLRERRERCCREAFPAALLSSAPRKFVPVLPI